PCCKIPTGFEATRVCDGGGDSRGPDHAYPWHGLKAAAHIIDPMMGVAARSSRASRLAPNRTIGCRRCGKYWAPRQARLRVCLACTTVTVPAITRPGSTSRPFRGLRGGTRNKSFEFGTWGGEFRAEFVPALGENTGAPAALPTPIWICSSRSTTSTSSSL